MVCTTPPPSHQLARVIGSHPAKKLRFFMNIYMVYTAVCVCSLALIVPEYMPCSGSRPVRPSRPAAGDRDGKVLSTSPSRVGGSGVSSSRSGPRLDLGVATRQILSGIGHSASSRSSSREGRRREREGTGAAVIEKTAGKKLENRAPISGKYIIHIHVYIHITVMCSTIRSGVQVSCLMGRENGTLSAARSVFLSYNQPVARSIFQLYNQPA